MTAVNLGDLRLGQPGCPSDLSLDCLSAKESSPAEAAALRSHIDSCAHCATRMQLRRKGFDGFPELDAGRPLRALQDFFEASQRPRKSAIHERILAWLRGPRLAFVGMGAVAVAVAGIVLVRASGSAPETLEDAPQKVRIKGAFALHVYRQKGQGAEEMMSGDRFHPGDNLRFAVDLPREGYVSILGVESQGQVYVAWPRPESKSEKRSAVRHPAGKRQELPGGVVLDGSLANESLYLVQCQRLSDSLACRSAGPGREPLCPDGCSLFQFVLNKSP